jgi:hypothetical protein
MDAHLLVTVASPILTGAVTAAVQNWIQKDDVKKSLKGGFGAAVATLLMSLATTGIGGK